MPDDELNDVTPLLGSLDSCNGIVLVHDGPDCAARAARLLSWYDAGAHVAPHEEQCDCVADHGRPSAACPRCHGTGRRLVLDNPEAKFTVAQLVAIWDQWDVSDLARMAGAQCQAIVTPDGEWHGRGSRGSGSWLEEALYLLSDHAHFAALGYRFAFVTSV